MRSPAFVTPCAGEIEVVRNVRPFGIARFFTYAEERDRALHWLEIAYQWRSFGLLSIQVNPDFDILRSDPRFQDIVRRINFPK